MLSLSDQGANDSRDRKKANLRKEWTLSILTLRQIKMCFLDKEPVSGFHLQKYELKISTIYTHDTYVA